MNVQQVVRKSYAKIAKNGTSCCGTAKFDTNEFAKSIGYSQSELSSIPENANLGLSCGNPISRAHLKKGETVLDLGSGAGFDCFIAAKKVGRTGKIIGVDMTPEMIDKARENARSANLKNVEFRLGEIENLPAADNSVDVVISNCVINLSQDKSKVFKEIRRVLKPGGRVSISDMALLKKLPAKIARDPESYSACVSGALLLKDYRNLLKKSGLKKTSITAKAYSPCSKPNVKDLLSRSLSKADNGSAENYVVSIYVEGVK